MPFLGWWTFPRPMATDRGVVMGSNGMVASAHPLATGAGVDVLRRGGSFMDAALATAAMLNVVEPYNSNLGADVFMIVYDAWAGTAPIRSRRVPQTSNTRMPAKA